MNYPYVFTNRGKKELTNDNNYIRKETTTKHPLNVEESSTGTANNADDATILNYSAFVIDFDNVLYKRICLSF